MATEFKLSYTASEIDKKLGKVNDTVTYTPQTLTEEQKAQARENIGAGSIEEVANIGDTLFGSTQPSDFSITMEQGYVHTDGSDYSSPTRIRCSGYLDLSKVVSLTLTAKANYQMRLIMFDENKTVTNSYKYIRQNTSQTFAAADCAYLRFYVEQDGEGTKPGVPDPTKPDDYFTAVYEKVMISTGTSLVDKVDEAYNALFGTSKPSDFSFEMERGTILYDGSDTYSTIKMRTVGYLDMSKVVWLNLAAKADYQIKWFRYNADKTLKDYDYIRQNASKTFLPSECAYLRFTVEEDDEGTKPGTPTDFSKPDLYFTSTFENTMIDTGPALIEKVEEMYAPKGKMELTIEDDNSIYLRTPYTENNDLVHYMSKYDGGNGTFRMWYIYRIPHTNAAYDFTTSRVSHKIIEDDVPPVSFGGTFIGGGHGCDALRIVNCPSHGKTEADIGSVWLSANGQKYIIAKIVDADTLWIIYNCYGTASVKNIFYKIEVTSPLTHVNGAANTEDITFTETPVNGMLSPCTANYAVKVLDGDSEIIGDYQGVVSSLRIIEQYDIISPVAVVNHLVDNVGKNTNESYHDASIGKWLTCNLVYEFSGENSACAITTSYIARTALNGYIMGTQCAAISASGKLNATVFDTKDYQTIFDMPAETISWKAETWSDANIPASRVCIYNPSETRSMCIGYEQLSTAKDSVRKDKGGYIWTSPAHKMYPVIASGDFVSGDVIQAVCYRIPFEHESVDVYKMYFYKLQDTYYVFVDFYGAYGGMVEMPTKIPDGSVVEVVKSSNATLGTDVVFDGMIAAKATDFGYLHLRVKG